MLSIVHQHDYRCALGSVYPFDPQIPSSWFATRYVMRNVRAGSIIVLHDYGARAERTIAALQEEGTIQEVSIKGVESSQFVSMQTLESRSEKDLAGLDIQ